MNKRKILTCLPLGLLIIVGFTQPVFSRCEGNAVFADYQEIEPNNDFSQAQLIPLSPNYCNTVIGHAGPRDSEYYGNKLNFDCDIFDICTMTVVSDLYRMNVSEFPKIRIQTLADTTLGNIGFVIFQSNGDNFTNYLFPGTSSNYREETFQLTPGTYYIGIVARKNPDTYYLSVEKLVPDLCFCSSNLSGDACCEQKEVQFILNKRNLKKGIRLYLDKTNFGFSDTCNSSSSSRYVMVTGGTFLTVKVDQRYARKLRKTRQTETVTITATCTNGIETDLPVVLTPP